MDVGGHDSLADQLLELHSIQEARVAAEEEARLQAAEEARRRAEQAAEQWTAGFNPRVVTRGDFHELYRKVFEE